MMKLYNNNPNLTIILPVGCNAKCGFCFWHSRGIEGNYLKNIKKQILKTPREYFNQVSISGGEPTMFNKEMFKDLLSFLLSVGFKKIVLNTNGYKLLEFLQDEFIRKHIDYINLSRHSIDDKKNYAIFNTKTVPSTKDIIEINKIKPVRLNCVFKDNLNYDEWIHYVKNTNSEGVAFRRLASEGVNIASTLETLLDNDSSIDKLYKSKCRVCYGANYRVGKLNIVIRYSVDETIDYMPKNTIYELVSDGKGNLHHTWDNNINTIVSDYDLKVKYNRLERFLTKLYKFLFKEEI